MSKDLSKDYWEKIFERVTDMIDIIVGIIGPVYELHLVGDGVVPKAKIVQQMKRSYAMKNDENVDEVSEQSQKLGEPFIRSQIKPGTEFTEAFTDHIIYWIKRKKGKENYPNLVVFSHPRIPGEGEHKIMETLVDLSSLPNDANDMIDVIYGPDSDMHILGMLKAQYSSGPSKRKADDRIKNLKKLQNDVVNEDQKRGINKQLRVLGDSKKQTSETHLIIMREVHEWSPEKGERWEYYDIGGIRDAIKFDLGNYEDFIVLTYLVGNDFVPNIPECRESSQALMGIYDTYKRTFGNNSGRIAKGDSVDWGNFLIFLKALRSMTNKLLKRDLALTGDIRINDDEYREPEKISNIPIDRASLAYTNAIMKTKIKGTNHEDINQFMFGETWKHHIFGIFEPEYVSFGDKNGINDLVQNWLSGILWTWLYYSNRKLAKNKRIFTRGKRTAPIGEHLDRININWAYYFPYGPSIENVIDFLESNRNFDWQKQALDSRSTREKIKPPFASDDPELSYEQREAILNTNYLPTPTMQLMAILPKPELSLIRNKSLVNDLIFSLPDMYPDSIVTDLDMIPIGREHMGKVLMRIPSMERIRVIYERNRGMIGTEGRETMDRIDRFEVTPKKYKLGNVANKEMKIKKAKIVIESASVEELQENITGMTVKTGYYLSVTKTKDLLNSDKRPFVIELTDDNESSEIIIPKNVDNSGAGTLVFYDSKTEKEIKFLSVTDLSDLEIANTNNIIKKIKGSIISEIRYMTLEEMKFYNFNKASIIIFLTDSDDQELGYLYFRDVRDKYAGTLYLKKLKTIYFPFFEKKTDNIDKKDSKKK